jgi:hypothetical protein
MNLGLNMDYIIKDHWNITQKFFSPLNINSALEVWNIAQALLLDLIVPPRGTSMFYPVMAANNLSYLSMAYYCFVP